MALRAWRAARGRGRLASLRLWSITSIVLSTLASASASSVRPGFPISLRYMKAAEGKGLDAEVTMCHAIEYEAYQRAPEDLAGYDELVKRYCGAPGTTTTALLSQALRLKAPGREDGPMLSAAPTGFVFLPAGISHLEARLLTGALAASPAHRVVAMPYVLTQAAQDCRDCSEATIAQVLKDLMWLMGAAPSSPKAADRSAPLLWLTLPWDLQVVVLRAFPSTPWLFTFSEPLWSLQHGSCLSSGGSEEECARELQMVYLSALAALRKSPGRALELRESLSTEPAASDSLIDGLLELLVPGHFHVALSDSEKTHMRSAVTHIRNKGCKLPGSGPVKTSDQLGSRMSRARLPQLYADLQDAQNGGTDELKHTAWEKRQEAYVYGKTGGRFYDTLICPDVPQRPRMYNVMEMIANWHPDNSSVPPRYYDSICRFDYTTEWHKAMAYRDAEVPFVLYKISSLDEATKKWSTPGYLSKAFDKKMLDVETCNTSHFQYYYEVKAKNKSPEEYQRPSQPASSTFDEWYEWAVTHKGQLTPNDEHIYLKAPDNLFFERDLPILAPTGDVFEFPDDQGAITCRFGIQGTVVDTHFDNSRNIAAQIAGSRRWILNPPEECHNSYLLGYSHPSYRHSSFDWARPVDLEKYPLFAKAVGTEVVLTEGDVLYVPAFWQHTISTLEGLSYHCNSLGGHSSVGLDVSRDCGFYDDEQMLKVWEEEARKTVYRKARRRRLKQHHMKRLRKLARGRVMLVGKD